MTRTIIAFALIPFVAIAAPPPDADPALHDWFDGQHSVTGAWCCLLSDGHILDDSAWRQSGDGYEIRIDGAWVRVPPNAARDPKGGPNPTGAAVAWWIIRADGPHVYCFAPGALY
jgi:hypothetical protein